MSLMPSCKDITEKSSDYLDKNQTLIQRLIFFMHIFICVNCKMYVTQLKLTIATIGKTDGAVPQPVDEHHINKIVDTIKLDVDAKN